MSDINLYGVNVTVNDPDNNFLPNKDIKVVINYNEENREMAVTVPLVQKRDTTPCENIYLGARSKIKVSLRKTDGRPYWTWIIDPDVTKRIGWEMIRKEMNAALDAIKKQIGE